ncbi:hypothetical protein TNCV_1059031 [Trichonephila clavipes]|nr:hypothetical protein TNCV_1059031 [Trichonephila clavipes]
MVPLPIHSAEPWNTFLQTSIVTDFLAEVSLIRALADHLGKLISQCAIFCEEPPNLRCISTPHNLQGLQQDISPDIAVIPAIRLRSAFRNFPTREQKCQRMHSSYFQNSFATKFVKFCYIGGMKANSNLYQGEDS